MQKNGKKVLRKVTAMLLALVMVVCSMPFTPVRAAKSDVLFKDSIKSNMLNEQGSEYYWKGQQVTLSVAAMENAVVTWSVDKSGVTPGENVKGQDVSGGYVENKVMLEIATDAAGQYTVTARADLEDNYQELTYLIEVQEKDSVIIYRGIESEENIYTNTPDFSMVVLVNENCTDAQLEQLAVQVDEENPDDPSKDVITDVSANLLSGTDAPEIDTSQYPGCKAYTYTLKPPVSLENELNKIALTLKTVKDGNTEETLAAKYWVMVRATAITDFRVTSTNKTETNSIEKYSHMANNIIFLDSDEVITITGSVIGTTTDIPILSALNIIADYNQCGLEYTTDKENNKIDFTITLGGRANRAVDNGNIRVTTLSGLSKEYGVQVYNINSDFTKFSIAEGRLAIASGSGISVYQYYTSELVASGIDVREEIEWSSSVQSAASVVSNGIQKATLSASGFGTTVISAKLKPTPASQRGQTYVFNVVVSEVKDPDQFTIDYSAIPQGNKIAKGSSYQLSAKAYQKGIEIAYPDTYKHWYSTDTKVLTVDENGKITAVGPGTASVYLEDIENVKLQNQNSLPITVYSPVTNIVLQEKNYENAVPIAVNTDVAEGQSAVLFAQRTPATGVEDLKWRSSDPEIISVVADANDSSIARVKFLKEGYASVTAEGQFTTNVSRAVTFNVKPRLAAALINITGGDTWHNDVLWLEKGNISKPARLNAIQLASNGLESNDALTWYCEPADQGVINISQDVNGRFVDIIAAGTGEVKLYAKNQSGVVSAPVTVRGVVYATNIQLASVPQASSVGIGNTLKIKPTLTPADSTELKDLVWSSADSTVLDFVRDASGNVVVDAEGCVEVKGISSSSTQVQISAKTNSPSLPRTGTLKLYVREDLSTTCTVEAIDDVFYTGKAHQPLPVIKNQKGETLVRNTHYRLTYAKNIDIGVGTVTATGVEAAGYTGTVAVNFDILPVNLNSETTTIADVKQTLIYNGSAQIVRPAVTVTLPDGTVKSLSASTDFTYSYANNINAGTMTVTVTGNGNYSGIVSKKIVITAKDMSSFAVTMKSTFEYQAGAIVPPVTIKDGTKTLRLNKDYKVTAVRNINPSTARSKPVATITGIGNYKGRKTMNFTIVKRNIAKLNTRKLQTVDYIYNNRAKRPAAVLSYKRLNGTTVKLRNNIDYTIRYYRNVKRGRATATITGKGLYTGRLSLVFYIAERVTVSRASITGLSNSATRRLTVRYRGLSRAAGYQVSVALNSKFTSATTKTLRGTTCTLTGLVKGKKYYVRVRAYRKNSLGRTVYGGWSTVRYLVIKR